MLGDTDLCVKLKVEGNANEMKCPNWNLISRPKGIEFLRVGYYIRVSSDGTVEYAGIFQTDWVEQGQEGPMG